MPKHELRNCSSYLAMGEEGEEEEERGEWHATQTKFLQSTAAHNSRFVELVTTSDMCRAGRTGLTLTLTASHVAFYKQVGGFNGQGIKR